MINDFIKNNKNLKRGMTLIETLVAISILMVAVSGALTLASQSLRSSNIAKDQITVSYLAQDGMEIVKNVRDSGFLGSTWLINLGPCTGSDGCIIDPTSQSPVGVACSGTCPVLKYDPATGRYGYTTNWQDSPYTRTIKITDVAGNADEKLVSVTVAWKYGLLDRTYSIRETIYDWYK